MIERVALESPTAAGWRFTGRVDGDDYRRLNDDLEARPDGPLDLLCEIDRSAHWSPGAMWEDARLARYTGRLRRLAVVGDARWVGAAAGLARLWPGWEVRHFGEDGRDAARAWIETGEA